MKRRLSSNSSESLTDGEAEPKGQNDDRLPSSYPPPHPRRRYMMTVAYDGTRFKGFQRQTSVSSTQSASMSNDTADDKRTLRKNKARRHDNLTGKILPVSTTIQELLEDALEMYASSLVQKSSQSLSPSSSSVQWSRDLLRMRFAGRTDAGVHARGQVIAVDLPVTTAASTTASTSVSSISGDAGFNNHNPDEELWRIRRSINSRLPVDISIESVEMAPHDDFDPRKEATRKRYSYTLRYRRQAVLDTGHNPSSPPHGQQTTMLPICAEGGPNLLRSAMDPMNGRCWIVPWTLDDSKLEEYCTVLTGTHDFSAFVHKSSREQPSKHPRTIDILRMDVIRTLNQDGADICDVRFTTEAKGFGRNQVRYMIGFLIDLCRGDGRGELASDIQPADGGERLAQWLWNDEQDYETLASKIQKAAACGLVLEKVYF